MKTTEIKPILGKMYIIPLTFLALWVISSCSQRVAFTTSSVVPAAEGKVKVKKDKNNNYHLDLEVIRLADPQRLTPARNVYVVWMDTERNGTQNLGQLTTSSGLFSSALKSSLQTVTPYKPVRIYITAENNSDIMYAGGQKVLETNNF